MTPQDIIDLLPIVAGRGWRLTAGMIRDRDGRCPLCSLANEIDPTWVARSAGDVATRAVLDPGSTYYEAASISNPLMRAADGGTYESLRLDMREALGMK